MKKKCYVFLALTGVLFFQFNFLVKEAFSVESERIQISSATEQEKKSLHEIMMEMEKLWQPIGRAIIKKEFSNDVLTMIFQFQGLTYSAVDLVPSKIDLLPEPEKRGMHLRYLEIMSDLLKHSYMLEIFYSEQNFSDSQTIFKAMQVLKSKGHDLFKNREDEAVPEHTFTIQPGTGSQSWNTKETAIRGKVGESVRIYNGDSVAHQLHTNGAPCGHGSRMNAGAYFDCIFKSSFDSDVSVPLYDHGYGSDAKVWIYVSP